MRLPSAQDFLRAQIHHLAVAGENVVQAHGHLQRLVPVLEVAARLGILVVVDDLDEFLPGRRVEAEETEAAIEKHGASRDAAHGVIFHEHAAVDGPRALDLLEGAVPA